MYDLATRSLWTSLSLNREQVYSLPCHSIRDGCLFAFAMTVISFATTVISSAQSRYNLPTRGRSALRNCTEVIVCVKFSFKFLISFTLHLSSHLFTRSGYDTQLEKGVLDLCISQDGKLRLMFGITKEQIEKELKNRRFAAYVILHERSSSGINDSKVGC